jgi:hypothetical protein
VELKSLDALLELLAEDYDCLTTDMKMLVCKVMKRTRQFNYRFMEHITFEAQVHLSLIRDSNAGR